MDNNGAKKKFIDKLKFMKNPFVANKIMVNIVLILFRQTYQYTNRREIMNLLFRR